MKIYIVSAEVEPFAKSGGLGDVIGALPKMLVQEGAETVVAMPLYATIDKKYKDEMSFVGEYGVALGWRNQTVKVYTLVSRGVRFYFLGNDMYYCGSRIYDEYDLERFAFFAKAALEILPHVNFVPDVIQCNDWSSALTPVYLDCFYRKIKFYSKIKTVLTIHNLAYQGIFPIDQVKDITGLPDDCFASKLEYYGSANLLKGGIVYSNIVSTVSPKYAEEIRTREYGEGLEGLLQAKKKNLFGIINGIDYSLYNPESDNHLYMRYGVDSYKLGKQTNKEKLLQSLGLSYGEAPLIVLVSRLVEQKGLDLIESVIGDMMKCNMSFVLLGTGAQKYEEFARSLCRRYPDRVAACVTFNNDLAHKFYAAGDLFLMPSRFEPCGLSQMIALKYGTLPIVREVGGLFDTVKSFNEQTEKGNGFSFTDYNAHDMLFTVYRAVDFYFNRRREFNAMIEFGMQQDFGWQNSAKAYIKLFEKAINTQRTI
ncbi:MAG: glycogen/starch synthase [Clostridia bacterium]|nr:glycogen/starch synthase [Clostridia bacterium]